MDEKDIKICEEEVAELTKDIIMTDEAVDMVQSTLHTAFNADTLDEAVVTIDDKLGEFRVGIDKLQTSSAASYIKDSFKLLLSCIESKYKLRFNKRLEVSKKINDIYAATEAILKDNKDERNHHKNDPSVGSYNFVYINYPKRKRRYNFQYAEVYLPAYEIMEIIDGAARSYAAMKNKATLEDATKEITDYLSRYYAYVLESKIEFGTPEKYKGTLEKNINYTKNRIDCCYGILYSESIVMSNINQNLLALNKAFGELERKLGGDKVVLNFVMNLMKECLKYSEAAINYNFEGATKIQSLYEGYYEQLKGYYDQLK